MRFKNKTLAVKQRKPRPAPSDASIAALLAKAGITVEPAQRSDEFTLQQAIADMPGASRHHVENELAKAVKAGRLTLRTLRGRRLFSLA